MSPPPPSGGVKQGNGRKYKPFSSYTGQYLENDIQDTLVTLMTIRKAHMRFRSTPRSMTLDDVDLQ